MRGREQEAGVPDRVKILAEAPSETQYSRIIAYILFMIGISSVVLSAKLLQQTGGDGINGDTMDFIPESFWTASLQAHHPLAFEPEIGGTDEALNWDVKQLFTPFSSDNPLRSI